MKVVLPKNGGLQKKPIVLSLKNEEEDKYLPKDKIRTFEIYTDPADTNSAKYKTVIRILDGTESLRTTLGWATDSMPRIINGLAVTSGANQVTIIRELLRGAALTAFNSALDATARVQRSAAADAAYVNTTGDQAAKQAAKETALGNDLSNYYTSATITVGLRGLVTAIAPAKALQKVKRYLRRECRKPADMKIREYYTLLSRINNDEIPNLPPFGGDAQKITPDEINDIICYGVPKSWTKEMDRQGKDPDTMTPNQLVNFLEQIENAEDFVPDGTVKNKKDGKKKSSKSNNNKEGDFYCMVHGKNHTHNSDDCNVLKREAKKLKGGNTSSGTGGGNSSNKTWSRKAEEARKKSRGELNAIIKEAVKEELNSLKRKSDDDSSVEPGEVSNIEKEMFDLGIDDELQKDIDVDEISV